MAKAPQLGELKLDEVRIYASVELPRELALRGWLDRFLDRQPGFSVFVRRRRARPKSVHCRECGEKITNCPHCDSVLKRAAEKGVDSAIVTDMMSLAWDKAFEVAILVSSDADLIPAVERLQDRGLKIVNATWSDYGFDLAKTCWAAFTIDPLIPSLARAS